MKYPTLKEFMRLNPHSAKKGKEHCKKLLKKIKVTKGISLSDIIKKANT